MGVDGRPISRLTLVCKLIPGTRRGSSLNISVEETALIFGGSVDSNPHGIRVRFLKDAISGIRRRRNPSSLE
jgi:hypothetical protein